MSDVATESDLTHELESRLGVKGVRLSRIRSNCVSRAYRVAMPNGTALFCKIGGDDGAVTRGFLSAIPPQPFLPRPIAAGNFRLKGEWVSCYVWRDAEHVSLDALNDERFDALCENYRRLVPLLQKAPVASPRVNGTALAREIRAYADRFWICRRLIAPLLSLGEEDYCYSPDTPDVIVHGDFHAGNFGFVGNEFAYFCDFDLVAHGGPVDDLVFMVVERVKRSGMGRKSFGCLAERIRQLVSRSGRPVDEWRRAVNLLRLRVAVTLVRRHPDRRRTAVNVMMRDRRLRRILKIIGEVART